jgi:chaperonin cofactor prefoldin
MDEARLEGLDIEWSEGFAAGGHAALWADNGTGKTTITALRYALYLPHPREFIRGDSDRSLAKLVRSAEVCHVVEQATRVVHGERQRLVTGMVVSWADGGTQDLDNPSKLTRTFYGWLTGADGPTIDDLPFRTDAGRWATHKQFTGAVREIMPHGGAAPPHQPSEHQKHWQDWLLSAGVDLEQVRFQTVMNASEGGVDRVMRFADSDAFVRWLIGSTMPTSTVEQITNSVDTLRTNAEARPRWEDELLLWEGVGEPLLDLAVAHEQVARHREQVAIARVDAAVVVAIADATIAELTAKQATELRHVAVQDRLRREAQATARRAQAHRLRMHLRAAQLRVDAAGLTAQQRRAELDAAVADHSAWRLVGDVLHARELTSAAAGLEERIDAAEQETAELRRTQARHRHELARLLTHRRDAAAHLLAAAGRRRAEASSALAEVEAELEQALEGRAAAAEQVRRADAVIAESEQVVAAAVTAGLLDEGDDPAVVDARFERRIHAARGERDSAAVALERISADTAERRAEQAQAHRKASQAHDDVTAAQQALRAVEDRVATFTEDERLLAVVADTTIELWTQRSGISDALKQRASTADAEAAVARDAMAEARRVVDSVRDDGLLPPSAVVEEAVLRCQAADVPAWSGLRWLADTVPPADAAVFATVRADIASGVVVATAELVDAAVAAIGDLSLDVVLWVGAVLDLDEAARGERDGGTWARLLLPPAGTYDKDAASAVVSSAQEALTSAADDLRAAEVRAVDSRNVLAGLERLWQDHPDDPREDLGATIRAAMGRRAAAEADGERIEGIITDLDRQHAQRRLEYDAAQQTIDTAGETRLALAPVCAAADALLRARASLPEHRDTVERLTARIGELRHDKQRWTSEGAAAEKEVPTHIRARDDAAEALRTEGLSATTDGPLPDDDQATIKARLVSVEGAVTRTAVDPEVHQELGRKRQSLSDVNSRLGADPALRVLAEQFADTDGARHPVALATATRGAEAEEKRARDEAAKADALFEQARDEHQRRAADSADRSSPDVDDVPSATIVTDPNEADRLANRLDDLAAQQLDRQRTADRLAREAEDSAQRAQHASELLETTVKPLRHLADPGMNSSPESDTRQLRERISKVSERIRTTDQALTDSLSAQRGAADRVRGQANGPQARKVEDRKDPRVVDLIIRLRGDDQLPAEAERIAGHLEQRIASLRDDLAQHDENVRTSAAMLHVQAAMAIQRLRAYQNQSRLPAGLGDWSDRRFVDIEHEPVPIDESVAVDRVARVVHAQLVPGAGKSDATTMLFAAARALVDAPFRVRLLKPHTDLALDRVDVAELKNFSGGQRVTAGVLLYASMTRVRGAGDDAASIGWLWLDNPFGQASADQFVRTMRLAADKLGLQLVFTAAPKDKGALSMFDRVITLARRTRPSSKEGIVVVDRGEREIVDLAMIQKDVMAVLGE